MFLRIQELEIENWEYPIQLNIISQSTPKSFCGTLPEPIRTRQDKVGFETPSNKWFREKKYQEFIFEMFKSESFKSRPFFNNEKIASLFEHHLSEKISISQEIWKWINLELWYREFID